MAIDATADAARMQHEIAKICPADAEGFLPFLAENRAKFARFKPVLARPFLGLSDYARPDMLRSLPWLRPHLSVDADLRRHFRDPRVRLAFSFQTKYLGMSPFRCPSLFTILSFLEYEYGVFHPKGAAGRCRRRWRGVAERAGVEIRRRAPVERIAFAGRRAVGVEVAGRQHAADAVVVNADFAHAIPAAGARGAAPRWTDRRIARARYSLFFRFHALPRRRGAVRPPRPPHHRAGPGV